MLTQLDLEQALTQLVVIILWDDSTGFDEVDDYFATVVQSYFPYNINFILIF